MATNCKNCKSEILESHDYCNQCGARFIRKRLTISNLIRYFIENFLDYDNTFLKTIRDLVVKPENVTSGYVKGLRKRYNSPINFFAISLSISGVYLFFVRKFYPDYSKIFNFYDNQGAQEFTNMIGEYLMDYNSLFYFFLC